MMKQAVPTKRRKSARAMEAKGTFSRMGLSKRRSRRGRFSSEEVAGLVEDEGFNGSDSSACPARADARMCGPPADELMFAEPLDS